MKYFLPLLLICFLPLSGFGQTKVSGLVYDDLGNPIPFANVVFPASTQGTITNEDGRFYLESDDTYDSIKVSFVGFTTREIKLEKKVNYNLSIVLEAETETMDEVVIYTGKQPKKNNPAIDILRKIWANKRQNGLSQFDQYQYDKYEKVEFDLNTIDSALINSKIFN
ncbi:MAG: carboxypeptidase-like regulatory domain-containing protein, partial [Leeuwenhoekiella sp.]